MPLPNLNPLHLTSLDSFDLGDVESPDGRAHPVTANTPVNVVMTDPKPLQIPIVTPMGTINIPAGPAMKVADMVPSWPKHFGARLALAVVAIIVLGIVAVRLTK